MVNMKKAALTRNKRTTLTTRISALIAIKIRSPSSATGAPLPHLTTLELLSTSQRRTSLDHIPTHDCEVVRRAHLGREDTPPPSSACLWPCLWPCLSGCRRSSAPPPPPTPPAAPSPVLAAATLAATLARAAARLLCSGGRLCPLRGDRQAVARPLGRGCSHGHLVDVRRQGGGWWQDAEGADEGGGHGGEGTSRGEGAPPEGDGGCVGLGEWWRAARRAAG